MTEPKKPEFSKWLIFGFCIAGIAAFSGLGALITRAIQKVSSGHALDTYHTYWLVEFNYIGVLILFGAVIVVLLLGGVLRLREYFQWRALEKNMASAKVIPNHSVKRDASTAALFRAPYFQR